MRQLSLFLSLFLSTGILQAQWQTSGNNIYSTNSGNVGIGQSSPSFKLHINGQTKATQFESNSDVSSIGHALHDNFTYDQKTMGYYTLGWFNDTWNSSGPTLWASGFGGMKFFTGGTNPRLSIIGNGNVGIGTTIPSEKLHVAGNILTTGFIGTPANVPVVFRVNNILAGSTGSGANLNVSFGYLALNNTTTGSTNTAIGYFALLSNTTGSANTAIGNYALAANSGGIWNTAIGSSALSNNTSGDSNTAIGNSALFYNTTSGQNTAIGNLALFQSTGQQNTATGANALQDNNTGEGNTASGVWALSSNNTGTYNTAVGYGALNINTIGHGNTAVGRGAGPNANNWSYTTSIGQGASTTQNSEIRIGSSTVSRIGGQLAWSTWSDGRTKKNIRAEVPGLAFITLLQPVTYNLDMNAVDEIMKSDNPEINLLRDSLRLARSSEEIEIQAKARANMEKLVFSGFIAQDVEKAAQSIGYDFSGVDVPENDKSPYALRYAEFVVPLVKAVQELSVQNNKLQEQVNELSAKLNELIGSPKSTNVGNDGVKSFSFTLFPNPTSGFVTVDYTMYVNAQIFIELYNSFGQRVKMILPNQNQKAGTYSVQTSVGDLVSGTYIVKVSSGNQVESKQLVVNN